MDPILKKRLRSIFQRIAARVFRFSQVSVVSRKVSRRASTGQAGTNLVEVAIVLLIMGLFLSRGIIKGFQLTETARMQKTQTQIQEYVQAILSFREQYQGLPGTVLRANELYGGSNMGSEVRSSKGLEPDTANSAAWAQLSESGFIRPLDKRSKLGVPYPSSGMGGGFSLVYNDDGLWLRLGEEHDNATDGALLTTLQAKRIVQMLQDRTKIQPGAGVTETENTDRRSCIVDVFVAP